MFEEIKAAYRPRLPDLLARLYPAGTIHGNEFKIGSVHGEPGASLSFSLDKDVWKDFAGSDHGGDFIALMAEHDGSTLGEAATKISEWLGTTKKQPTLQDLKHRTHGTPIKFWEWVDANGEIKMVTARWDSPGPKALPYTWNGTKWIAKGMGKNRPLLGLRNLLERLNSPVLVVEGEKTYDAAIDLFPDHVVVTWSGGANATQHTDFKPLAGRMVTLWPDNDEPGQQAMAQIGEQIGHIANCWLVKPGPLPEKWDLADPWPDDLSEVTPRTVLEHWGQKIEPPGIATLHPEGVTGKLDLFRSSTGKVLKDPRNYEMILSSSASVNGYWWNSWADRIMVGKRPIDDSDLTKLRIAIMHETELDISKTEIFDCLPVVLPHHNPVLEWIQSLEWDGEPRLDKVDTKILHCDPLSHEWNQTCLRVLLCGMLQRAQFPGCKFDSVVILEGKFGIGKSQFVEILAGDPSLYTTTSGMESSHDAELYYKMEPVWLLHLEELQVPKRDLTRLKSFITDTHDHYRRKYGHVPVLRPRRCVIVASTDKDEYLEDEMGNYRRWLPLRCCIKEEPTINLDLFRLWRTQLFAECLHHLQTDWRESWYMINSEAQIEATASSLIQDSWHEDIQAYIGSLSIGTPLTMQGILTHLAVPHAQQGIGIQRRVGSILRRLGYRNNKVRVGNTTQRIWETEDEQKDRLYHDNESP